MKIFVMFFLFLTTVAWSIEGKVVAVYYGGSLDILTKNGEKIFVRMYGHEEKRYMLRDPKVVEARNYLADEIRNQNVTLDMKKSNFFGQRYVEIFHEGRNINVKYIKNGHAKYSRDLNEKMEEYILAERYAEENSLGLWKEYL